MFVILAGNHALVSHKISYHIQSNFVSADLVSVNTLIAIQKFLMRLELAFADVRGQFLIKLYILDASTDG